MSLDNLLGRTLEKIEPDKTAITRLLNAADRNIQDANVDAVSDENRFDADTVIILDTLRKQRHVADYSGDIVPESAMQECISCAENLYRDVNQWIVKHKPDLLTE